MPVAGAAAAGIAAAPAEEKKEERKPAKEESESDDMGFDLTMTWALACLTKNAFLMPFLAL